MENIEIELLLNYHNKLGDKFKEEKYKEIMEEINSIISGILLKTLLFSISDKNMINYIFSKLEQFLDNEVVIVNIISEIDKIFAECLQDNTNKHKKYTIDFKLRVLKFLKCFSIFIFKRFKISIHCLINENIPISQIKNFLF